MNAGVTIGETVLIGKMDPTIPVLDATRVVLQPVIVPASVSDGSSNVKELFLHQSLVGQYIAEGQWASISYLGRVHKFRVSCVEYVGHSSGDVEGSASWAVVRVTLSTKVEVLAKESKDGDSEGKPSDVVDFRLVGGLKAQIEELKELVELPLKNPELFLKYGLRPPRGVLLYGPPGTGKTLLAKVLAQVTGASCFTLSAPEIMSKYYGESEAKLRALFDTAAKKSPSLIFIDEIDAIAPKRDNNDSEVSKRIVGTLLTLLDGMDSTSASNHQQDHQPSSSSNPSSSSSNPTPSTQHSTSRVVILAATNRPNALDPALRRPGRFDREIEIPIPNEAGRNEILRVYFTKMQHTLTDDQISKVASVTHGYVGADLANLCKESALCAFKRAYHSSDPPDVRFSSKIDASSATPLSSSTPSSAASELSVSYQDVLHAMSEIRPSAMREIMVDIPKVKWEDIGGYDEVKEKLKQAVEWPLRHPDAFKRLNIQPTRGVLLYGPPGCSKTLMAKAVATEAGLNFIPIKGPELFSKYVGESEKAVREVFRKARAASPAIVFFDEIDAIGGERGKGSDSTSVHDRVLAQMLNELDGIEPLKSVLFLAATNRPDIIDKALMRPGRVDQAIYIPPPDSAARRKILEICLKKIPCADDVEVDKMVSLTSGFSGAEVTSACREAGLAALQEDINTSLVHQRHFLHAIQSIVPTITDSMIQFYENFANRKKQPTTTATSATSSSSS